MFKAPFSFNGRIRRMEYFLSFLVGGLIFGIAFFLGVGTALFGAASNSGSGLGVGVLIGFIALIADIWFSLAQYVKRLHDTDKSGWLILLSLIPVVNFALALYMLFADGTVGPNRYGLDPKNRMPYNASINVNVNVNGANPSATTTTTTSTRVDEF